jgi:hypothetical protein
MAQPKETVGAYLAGVDHANQLIADRTLPGLPERYVVDSLQEIDAGSDWIGSIKHLDTGRIYSGAGSTAFEAIDLALTKVANKAAG